MGSHHLMSSSNHTPLYKCKQIIHTYFKACWFHSWGASCQPCPCLHLQIPSCLSDYIPTVKGIHLSWVYGHLSFKANPRGVFSSPSQPFNEHRSPMWVNTPTSLECRHEARDYWCDGRRKTQPLTSQSRRLRKVSVPKHSQERKQALVFLRTVIKQSAQARWTQVRIGHAKLETSVT